MASAMNMLTIPKSVRLQSAADDAAVIAETIQSLAVLLDRFYEKHGHELGLELTAIIPWHSDLGPSLEQKIFDFASSLEPPEVE